MKKFDFISDAGHGWLKVPQPMLSELGIADKISLYSYVDGKGNAYLEEDCDATVFIKEYCWRENIKRSEFAHHIEEVNHGNNSWVRNLPGYEA